MRTDVGKLGIYRPRHDDGQEVLHSSKNSTWIFFINFDSVLLPYPKEVMGGSPGEVSENPMT